MGIFNDIWKYVCTCFWEAISFRQKFKAVGGLIAALLALPMIWAIGGTLELTAKGVWWGAAWLTISSLLLLFVFAPFFLWRESRPVIGPSILLSCRIRDQEIMPSGRRSKWLQVLVEASGVVPLVKCRVQMLSISSGGQEIYDEPLDCLWSNGMDTERTIQPGIPEGANLFSLIDGSEGLRAITTVEKPQVTKGIKGSGKYEVNVAVHADGAKVVKQVYIVDYQTFDEISFRQA